MIYLVNLPGEGDHTETCFGVVEGSGAVRRV